MKHYKIVSRIATGSFGKVSKATKISTNEMVAIKEIF
jgi:serine/threonine protein kinase